MVLYTFLRLLVLLTVRIFFKSSRIRNIENVPAKAPLIMAANHPSTFLDPLVLAVWLRRPLYFLTNGGVFSSRFNKWLLSKLFMVPIYRQQDSKEASNKNQDSFAACFDLLGKGGAITIFPEGSSENERRLRKVKTGIARIALGAEAQHDFKLGLKIVCAGINYTNPRRFQSKLFVQYDEPISVSTYREKYLEDPIEAVRLLTEEVGRRLEALIVITATEEIDLLTEKIETLYSNDLKNDLGLPMHETEQIFVMAQHIANAVHYYEKHEPARVDVMAANINEYFAMLEKYGISDETVANSPDSKTASLKVLRALPFLIPGFPFYLYGLLLNYLPYRLPHIAALRATKDVVFRAPIGIVVALFTFFGFYCGYGFGFYRLVKSGWITLGFLISLPVSGFFTFNYWHFLRETIENNRLAGILKQSTEIRERRVKLVRELERAKNEYMEVISGVK